MSRLTLARDFRSIDARSATVILIEAGPRILPMFSEESSRQAQRDLLSLGVQTRTSCAVTSIDSKGVQMGSERIESATVLWAAGVRASPLGSEAGLRVDAQGRVLCEPDLSVKDNSRVFVAGDQARIPQQTGKPLPGTAPVAMQQGAYIAKTILNDLHSRIRTPFQFVDKGQMATIGRSRAVIEIGKIRMSGFPAWLTWLAVHIYYLTGFQHRLLVVLQWAWSYLTFGRGARLIVGKQWRD
jgi:NADH dehydrogenase